MSSKGISVGVKIDGNAKGFKSAAEDAQRATEKMRNKMNSEFKSISTSFNNMAGALGATIAVTSIVNFGKEVMLLAAKAEGVEIAFNRLNSPDLLNKLQVATRDTVADLVLMQKAVQAKNFKIPLEQLATYFEFATKRAIQTGESVDYLVDSIITGIGRKSVLVMDNLGISAVELQDEIAKVGDFGTAAGNIIRRELESMGDVADTQTIKLAQMATQVDNLKVSWGNFLNQSGAIKELLQWITDELTIFADPNLNIWEKLNGSPNEYKRFKHNLEEIKRTFGFTNIGDMTKQWSSPWAAGVIDPKAKQVETINTLTSKLKEYNEELNNTDIKDVKGISRIQEKINKTQELINRAKGEKAKEFTPSKETELFTDINLIYSKRIAAAEKYVQTLTDKNKEIGQNILDAEKAETAEHIINWKDRGTTYLSLQAAIGKKAADEVLRQDKKLYTNRAERFKNLAQLEIDQSKLASQTELEQNQETYDSYEALALDFIKKSEDSWKRYNERIAKADKEALDKKYNISTSLLEKDYAIGLIGYAEYLDKKRALDIEYYKDSESESNYADAAYATAVLSEELNKLYGIVNPLQSELSGMFNILITGSDDVQDKFKEIGDSFRNMLAQMAAELAAKAVIFGILNSLSGGTSNMAIAAGKAADNFKWFADGGVVSGPTLAGVGEYANVKSNPEVIAPLSKLKSMLGTTGGEVTFKIQGDTLVGVLNKHSRKVNSFA